MNAKSHTIRWLGVGVAGGLMLLQTACTGNSGGTIGNGGATSGTGGSGTAGSGTTGTGTGGGGTGGAGTGSGGTAGTGSGKGGTGGATGGAGGATGGSSGSGGSGGSTGGSGGTGGGTGGSGGTGGGTGGSAGADAGTRPDASIDAGTKTDAAPPSDAVTPPTDAPSSGCGKATWPASGNFNIDVSGTMRAYIVKIPTNYDTNKTYRLVFAWHGLGGTAQQIAQFGYYGLESLSAGSAIFVAGQGLDTGMGGAGWPNTNGQDVNFVKALLDWMKSNYCIDQSRVFSVGMSYGGIMSNTLGCQMGGIFRAIAPMSGSGPFQFGTSVCVGQVAAWLSHGTADPTVSFDAGVGSRETWRNRNHCMATSTPTTPSPCVSYNGCDPGYPVTWCEFDGGHVVPTFAASGIWTFLSQF